MLNQYLYDDTIQLRATADDYRQALEICAQPLLVSGVITHNYLTAILRGHEKTGPYYVLAPGLAMPHARPQEGARATGLSLLKLTQGVSFSCEHFDPVDIILMLAATDSHSHIAMIASLSELFSTDDDMKLLHQAASLEEIKRIINRY